MVQVVPIGPAIPPEMMLKKLSSVGAPESPTRSIAARETPSRNDSAPVTATLVLTTGYVKSRSPQHTVRNAIPAAAGTNGALAADPNGSLATMIANATPATGSHSGALAGMTSAIASPVNTAEKSPSSLGRRIRA